ncbi:glycoside hydrolase family 95-like protein [uncultured Bacteroides sp.]|uniref:glycosyl hydrolase family 95 catalytic domain-containing protein n=1 Tax=uncultured Bacteroides sp. TaxID=162156 RepID=UPI0026383FC1|nr:hypothetical protein [uncultured Bacteroides sp.]
MKKEKFLLPLMGILVACGNTSNTDLSVVSDVYDLEFDNLANVWDEAMPLGNATLGSLVWQKGNCLRMSIDRVDLWDLRHSKELEGNDFSFKWLYNQVQKKDYQPVQRRFDYPYDAYPGPSKIPCAALEFPLDSTDKVKNIHLYQKQGVCEVVWESGKTMKCFIHAEEPLGWFVFNGVPDDFFPLLVPPSYNKEVVNKANDQSSHGLWKLGYEQGNIEHIGKNKILYHQKGWESFFYDVALKWEHIGNSLVGVWSVTSSLSGGDALSIVDSAMTKGISAYYDSHLSWWNDFNNRSSISIPDKVIEKQYYNEVYKMGCIARDNSYPISLQSVWTADNGQLPPWKGDYHHDLNTQLSYWPFYTGNYLKEGYGYLHTLWNQVEENKLYTKQYFGTEGLNVPGVCTLLGRPMGGWCQYALGPTVSAWLSQHFYLHWKYSQDREFLKNRAYPYMKDVATYLEQFTVIRNSVRTLPLSSSPEFNDNRLEAWFHEMTNFDRGLVRFAFRAASEMASELNLKEEAAHWSSLESELPPYLVDDEGSLSIAKGFDYNASHRHFSHLLAIHPLGLIDKSNGDKDAALIDASIAKLDKYGPDWWTGYSYSWLANLKARAFDGDGAAEALHTFAECFCLRNGFHANGDQSHSGKSKFTYRPFTLEGNMAFAAGVQEMLLQSHTGVVRIFPAIPDCWKDVSFEKLRAMGAFVISAVMKEGKVERVRILSEKGCKLRMALPFDGDFKINDNKNYVIKDCIIEMETEVGDVIEFIKI